MKKILLAATCMLVSILAANAQTYQTSDDGLSVTYTRTADGQSDALQPIYRSGNTYILGNSAMNKYQYAGYLRNTCPAAYAKFNTGYALSSAGWGLLAGGIGMQIGASVMYHLNGYHGDSYYHHIARGLEYTGHTCVSVSIPLLIVGYCKQHNSVGVYNSSIGDPVPYFSLNATDGGIGIAYNF